MDAFRDHCGDQAIPLFVVSSSNRLMVVTSDQPVNPKPGETLINLVDPEPATHPES